MYFKYVLKDTSKDVKIIAKPKNGTIRLYANSSDTFPSANQFEYCNNKKESKTCNLILTPNEENKNVITYYIAIRGETCLSNLRPFLISVTLSVSTHQSMKNKKVPDAKLIMKNIESKIEHYKNNKASYSNLLKRVKKAKKKNYELRYLTPKFEPKPYNKNYALKASSPYIEQKNVYTSRNETHEKWIGPHWTPSTGNNSKLKTQNIPIMESTYVEPENPYLPTTNRNPENPLFTVRAVSQTSNYPKSNIDKTPLAMIHQSSEVSISEWETNQDDTDNYNNENILDNKVPKPPQHPKSARIRRKKVFKRFRPFTASPRFITHEPEPSYHPQNVKSHFKSEMQNKEKPKPHERTIEEKILCAQEYNTSVLKFDGEESYVCLPPISLFEGFSIGVYLNVNNCFKDGSRIFETGCFNNHNNMMYLGFLRNTGRIRFAISKPLNLDECGPVPENEPDRDPYDTDWIYLNTVHLFPSNSWAHLDLTVSKDGDVKIYFNGYLEFEGNVSYLKNIKRDYFYIGRSIQTGRGFFYEGSLCDFKVYNYVRKPKTILKYVEKGVSDIHIHQANTLFNMHLEHPRQQLPGQINNTNRPISDDPYDLDPNIKKLFRVDVISDTSLPQIDNTQDFLSKLQGGEDLEIELSKSEEESPPEIKHHHRRHINIEKKSDDLSDKSDVNEEINENNLQTILCDSDSVDEEKSIELTDAQKRAKIWNSPAIYTEHLNQIFIDSPQPNDNCILEKGLIMWYSFTGYCKDNHEPNLTGLTKQGNICGTAKYVKFIEPNGGFFIPQEKIVPTLGRRVDELVGIYIPQSIQKSDVYFNIYL